MNIEILKRVGIRSVHRGLLIIRKHSPIILTATGIVGSVTATVLASRATLKLETAVSTINEGLEIARYNKKYARIDGSTYTDSDYAKDLAYIYARGSIDIIKLYAPAVSLGVASIGCIISAQGIMQKRNAALAAAYTVVEKGFSEYRKRVEEALGEDKERELRYGIQTEEFTNNKTGKVKTITHFDPNAVSIYARFFDELSDSWSRTPEYNLLFLKSQQQYANDLLHARGHVFLNEVYDSLGIPRSQAGQVVGWVIGPEGDNFVDFGIYDVENEKAREFVNGQERSILLDFNVNGVVYDKI